MERVRPVKVGSRIEYVPTLTQSLLNRGENMLEGAERFAEWGWEATKQRVSKVTSRFHKTDEDVEVVTD